MNYCINPWCQERQNPDNLDRCISCGTELLINERYRLISPLHDVTAQSSREVWLVDNFGNLKVLKILTENQPTLVKLFQREAQVLRLLKHQGIPNLETNFIFSPCNGPKKLHCLVMEKVEGDNLENWIANNGSISQNLALQWLKEFTNILHYVHQERFFHRDIKPSNIMRTPDGQLVLIDFGAVRKITGTYLEKKELGIDTTGIYSCCGYTPPEQFIGRAVLQSDFFSLGRTFVYLLTGKPPIDLESTDTGELSNWRESVPKLSKSLADLIDELMEQVPEKRPSSTQEILKRLEQINLDVSDTPIGNKVSDRFRSFINKLGKHKVYKPSFLLLSSLLFLTIYFGSGFHPVASFLNQKALQKKLTGNLSKAEFYYSWAIRLDPNYAEVRYNLGSYYEEIQQINKARHEYEIAAIREVTAAYNNLGRLDILAEDYNSAVYWLLKGLKKAKDDDKDDDTIYALHKNLGWARLGQKRYQEAEAHLQRAIEIKSDRAAAYCLLAQVLEAQDKDSRNSWENFQRYASSNNQDDDNCIKLANKSIASIGGKP